MSVFVPACLGGYVFSVVVLLIERSDLSLLECASKGLEAAAGPLSWGAPRQTVDWGIAAVWALAMVSHPIRSSVFCGAMTAVFVVNWFCWGVGPSLWVMG